MKVQGLLDCLLELRIAEYKYLGVRHRLFNSAGRMKSPCPLNLLLVLNSIHAWPSIIGQKLKSSSHLENIVRNDAHGIEDFDTPSEQRIRFLWSQQHFKIANNLVTGLYKVTPQF